VSGRARRSAAGTLRRRLSRVLAHGHGSFRSEWATAAAAGREREEEIAARAPEGDRRPNERWPSYG